MSHRLTRRQALAAGAVFAGTAAGTASASEIKLSDAINMSWSRTEGLRRDLTPGKTPIRLACWGSTTTFDSRTPGESLTEMVKRIRDRGYTSANTITPPGKESFWLNASDSEIAEFKSALKKYDVTIFDVHVYVNNIHPDLSIRLQNLKHTATQCEAAERIGSPMVTTHTGSCSEISPVTIHPENWTLAAWKTSVQSIKQILKDTAGMKVSLGIEALNLININNPKAHLRLMEDVGDTRCRVCFDPTNMMSTEKYFHYTEIINEGFDILGENIMACHAKDSLITPDKMSAYLTQVPPGEGVNDYETYLVRLSRMKWPRTLLIEHLSDDKYPAAKEYIARTAAKVGVKIHGEG
ncbi:MAG: sugar phosphate isomerase/epimerase [Candidatus Latescibacterota bacterium]